MDIEPVLRFRPLSTDDLPMLQEWLSRPHVAEWWDTPPSLAEVEQDYADSIAGKAPHWCYIVCLDEQPVGFIQSYSAVGFHHEGWWLDEQDPGVYGIDQFLAHPEQLGRGLGTRMVRAFVEKLLENPAVTRVQTDPEPRNLRAIRCYEKAGFHAVRELVTQDGPALLMYCDRPATAGGL